MENYKRKTKSRIKIKNILTKDEIIEGFCKAMEIESKNSTIGLSIIISDTMADKRGFEICSKCNSNIARIQLQIPIPQVAKAVQEKYGFSFYELKMHENMFDEGHNAYCALLEDYYLVEEFIDDKDILAKQKVTIAPEETDLIDFLKKQQAKVIQDGVMAIGGGMSGIICQKIGDKMVPVHYLELDANKFFDIINNTEGLEIYEEYGEEVEYALGDTVEERCKKLRELSKNLLTKSKRSKEAPTK